MSKVYINGVDITDYIAFRGLKWQRSDIDAAESGRTMDGTMRRQRVAKKRRLDVTCRPLKESEVATVLSLIDPEWVTVQYFDPQEGQMVTRTMYSNNYPASFLIHRVNGEDLWDGITFPLIEQ